MAGDAGISSAGTGPATEPLVPTFAIKAGLAQMLKGGVIMDVVNAEQVHQSAAPYLYSSDTHCQ